jgi:hypothetical protein
MGRICGSSTIQGVVAGLGGGKPTAVTVWALASLAREVNTAAPAATAADLKNFRLLLLTAKLKLTMADFQNNVVKAVAM